MAGLVCLLVLATGCGHKEIKIDRTPLPTVAAPPYLCDHIPLEAVRLMTGERDPLVSGHFNFDRPSRLGDGNCAVYQRSGDRLKVLQVILVPMGTEERVRDQLRNGAPPLPPIVPGAIGYFDTDPSGHASAHAGIARGTALLIVKLDRGVEGRDNAADVVALMKLIAPKLITSADAPTPTPSAGKG
ncbi:hypothetical protein OG320_30790 [Microbispora sp. NBC_01189]|uniref:hypothetical protein n=1 Tax=Microbispora sp. NBC_01189 TaxID=2903583 RepID=UPI002E143026|nr:hypothetical protein OG320_30790 [Microbispora sp. NBC_01189]